MAQIFWEQIRNELPSGGEALTGSLSVSGSLQTTKLQVTSSIDEDLLLIKNGKGQGIKVNSEGSLELIQYESLPTASQGAIAYSNNDFWIGIE